MNDPWFAFVPSLLFGCCLGTFFFVGLHYTVANGLGKAQPALWFLGSLLLRSVVVLGGFALIARGDAWHVILALVGFVLARQVVLRVTAPKLEPGAPGAS